MKPKVVFNKVDEYLEELSLSAERADGYLDRVKRALGYPVPAPLIDRNLVRLTTVRSTRDGFFTHVRVVSGFVVGDQLIEYQGMPVDLIPDSSRNEKVYTDLEKEYAKIREVCKNLGLEMRAGAFRLPGERG